MPENPITDGPITDESAFDLLVAANPAPPAGVGIAQPSVAAHDRLEIITAPATHVTEKTGNVVPFRRSTVRRGIVTRAAALVAVLAALAGVVGVALFGATPSAAAAFAEIAEETARLMSGRLEIEVDSTTADGVVLYRGRIEQRFDGEAYAADMFMEFTEAELSEEFGSQMHTSRIRLGDLAWTRLDPARDWVPDGEDNRDVFGGVGVNIDAVSPTGLIPLVESSDDFGEVDAGPGQQRFVGTIRAVELAAVAAGELPAGLSMFAGEGAIPTETVAVEAVAAGGVLETVTASATIEVPGTGESFVMTVRTRYLDIGDPQIIEPPSPDAIRATQSQTRGGDLNVLEPSAGLVDAMLEVFDRRPGLCEEHIPPIDFSFSTRDEAAPMREAYRVMMACFDEAGEPQISDEFRKVLPPQLLPLDAE